MPYYEVQNFMAGMDVRKSAVTAPAGTLRLLRNAFVNPGGEVEKRQAYVAFAPAPANSVGLMGKGDYLWAVAASGTTTPPTSTTVGLLVLAGLPNGVTITQLLDYEQYADKFYTCILGSDGLQYHHYDGVIVTGATGINAKTFKTKMYRVDGRYLRFSAVGAPADNTGTGFGFIDLSAEDSEMLNCRALEVYYDKLAVFSQYACQIWTVDPDPDKNTLIQTLRQAGIAAPRSAKQYGSGDVLYLSQDGIRSLKTREQSLTASVSDIGSPVDPYVKELLRADIEGMSMAISLLEPSNGRFWLVCRNQALVLANYPNPKISAWCVFDFPWDVMDAAVAGAFVYLRAANGTVYRYGAGLGTPAYDSTQAEVVLPYLHFEKPATFKQFKAIDVACQGSWDVYAGINPGNQTAEDLLGTVTGPTFLEGQFPFMGHSTHCSLRFRTTAATPCSLSSLMIHYDETITT